MYIFLFFSTILDWCKPYICGEPDQQFSGLLQKDDLQRRKSWFFNYRAISHISLWALPSGKYLLIHTYDAYYWFHSKVSLISDFFTSFGNESSHQKKSSSKKSSSKKSSGKKSSSKKASQNKKKVVKG